MKAVATDRSAPPALLRRTVEATLDVRAADEKARTVPVSFSSEEPVNRGHRIEVLSHAAEAVDLRRARAGLPLLLHHDSQRPVGVVEGVRIEGGKCRGVARFGKSAVATEAWNDVTGGVLRFLSVGYSVDEVREEPGGVDLVTRWCPHEVSLVGVPADSTVGVNRTLPASQETIMEPTTTAAPAAPAPRASAPSIDAERARVGEILAVARHDNYRRQIPDLDDRARRAIAEGTPVDAFSRSVLDALGTASPSFSAGATRVALSPIDSDDESRLVRGFSLARAVRAAVTGDWNGAGFEKEVSTEIARRAGRTSEGVMFPTAALATRNQVVGTASAGGALVGTDHMAGAFIGALRNESRVIGLGATVLEGLVRDVSIPRQTAGGTVYWVGENSDVTETAIALDNVTLKPHQLGCVMAFSRKLLVQGDPGIEALLRDDMREQIAIEVDRCSIGGSIDADAPLGLLTTPGVDVSEYPGAEMVWSTFTNLITKVAKHNGARGSTGFLTSYGMQGTAMATERAAGSGRFILDDENAEMLAGHRIAFTNNMDPETIIFGNWRDLLIGHWGGAEIIVDQYTGAASGQVRLALHTFWDFAVRRPAAFAAYTAVPEGVL